MAKMLVAAGGAVALAMLPFVVSSDFWLTWITMILFYGYLGQSWNILGGYGGQYSFGHAAFFGAGAYVSAILQSRFGVNAWVALLAATAAGGCVGFAIGMPIFRRGLRGSYFALVTLAFAEVFRVFATAAAITGGGVGLFVASQPGVANLQFAQKAGFFWLILALVLIVAAITYVIEKSRFGAYLVAVRESEPAARAVGVRVIQVKLAAIVISGAIAGSAGAVYVQMYRFIDPSIAYGVGISVEALLSPIVGGLGTVFGPLIGAFALQVISELTHAVFGSAAGLDLALYGAVVVVVVLFMPHGLYSFGKSKLTQFSAARWRRA